ncbi:MAG: histidinol phosphatase [Candidatus Pedobacter colombiensis]|uniref:protein-tyrosine-phosphatase n=1 Tax=Candidatus Pedobacter colombiensis TaxID=3121371 RepID=A0AAJ5WA54_9SPHI|nr:CpsB/CapC family capsule biosynthesis tyrosine phosphatase [Pedobacter sp.]WEK19709.1 MAG: histidinol phosphatase [Pedobacter sp.]
MISFFSTKKNISEVEWLGVDVHNHLLPGIDDGAIDIVQSISFIKALNELGFHKFICTPHIFTELYPNTTETITQALMDVKAALAKTELNVEVNAAAEYMVDETFKLTKNLLCLPGQHILIEMSYLSEMPQIEQVIFDLQLAGFKVILAHPERYFFYHKKPERYERLKDMGVLFQLNLLALSGYYGPEVKLAAGYLLKKHYYDFAGTDLHHQKHLKALQDFICSGGLYKMIGHYPFKNKALF